MVSLLNRSIPDFTPRATTHAQTARKIRCIPIGVHVEEMKPPNNASAASGDVPTKSKAQALNK